MVGICCLVGLVLTIFLGMFFSIRKAVDSSRQLKTLDKLKKEYEKIDSAPDGRSDLDVLRQQYK